ncbi:MAG: SPFH domain-containing protein [Pseudomonadota bacterium]
MSNNFEQNDKRIFALLDRLNSFLKVLVSLTVITVICGSALSFKVIEGMNVLVLRFGEIVRVEQQAGLHFKAPWPIERLITVDGRARSSSTPPFEVLTRDKKNIVLVTGVVWRTTNPAIFFRSLSTVSEAEEKILGLAMNANISVLGGFDLSALVSTEQSQLQINVVQQNVLDAINAIAIPKYGVEAKQVGFQRISLPTQNTQFVLEQMRAERRRSAARFIADGERKASEIRSTADLEAARIIAAAEESAARTLGSAESEAARIYAEAHRLNPDFYRFVRSLETLENTLGAGAQITLRTDAAPFDLLVRERPLSLSEHSKAPDIFEASAIDPLDVATQLAHDEEAP